MGAEGTLMLEDLDPAETREWLEALDSVLAYEGADRAFFLLDEVVAEMKGGKESDVVDRLKQHLEENKKKRPPKA